MIPYGIAHCHACFDLYGNGFLLTRQWSLLSILLTLDCGLNFNVYKMASKLHCLTNQDKPDNGQWHRYHTRCFRNKCDIVEEPNSSSDHDIRVKFVSLITRNLKAIWLSTKILIKIRT